MGGKGGKGARTTVDYEEGSLSQDLNTGSRKDFMAPVLQVLMYGYVATWSINYEARISYQINHMAVNMNGIPIHVKNGPNRSSPSPPSKEVRSNHVRHGDGW